MKKRGNCRVVSFPSRADQHHPEQFVNTLKVSAQPAPPTVTDLAPDLEVPNLARASHRFRAAAESGP